MPPLSPSVAADVENLEAKGQGADDVFAKVRGNEELVVVKHDAVKGAPLVS